MSKSSLKLRQPARAVTRPGRATHTKSEDAALTVTATEAKTRFGPILETAIQGRFVVITKHDTPKAVLLSIAEFESLVRLKQPSLDALTGEFDSLLARMQSTSSRAALKSAFGAAPAELGRLAVSNARRRG
jgi:prevent-host-death family protein